MQLGRCVCSNCIQLEFECVCACIQIYTRVHMRTLLIWGLSSLLILIEVHIMKLLSAGSLKSELLKGHIGSILARVLLTVALEVRVPTLSLALGKPTEV